MELSFRSAALVLYFLSTCALSDQNKASPLPLQLPELSYSTEPPSLVNMTAMPSSIVNGSVNVITGDYCIAGADHIVSGPDPFTLGHSYFSSSLKDGTLGNGWNFFHNHLLQVYQPGKIEYVVGYGGSSTHLMDSEASTFESTPETESCAFFNVETNEYTITDESHDGSDSSSSYQDEGEYLLENLPDFMDYDEIRCFTEDRDELDPEDLDTDGDESETKRFYPPHPRIPIFFGDASHHDHHRDRDDYPGGGVSKNPPFVFLVEPSGGKIAFKGKYKHGKITDLKIQTKDTGFTNVAAGEISGQTNIKNITPTWDRKNDIWTVTLGDGTVRRYERQWKKSEIKHKHPHHAAFYRDYHLTKETLPSGNIVVYDYNDKFEITGIRTFNKNASHKLNWVQFKQKSPGQFSKLPALHVKSSDDQDIYYYFKKLKGGYLDGTYAVSGIKRPGQAYTRFNYSQSSSRHKRRVIRHEQEDGYFVETKYYRAAENKMGSRTVEPKNKSERHFLKNRVRMQLAPVGPDGKKAITHRYFYHKDKGKKSGHATVRDAYNNITRYYWNGSKRITKIDRLEFTDKKKENLLKRETFIWGKGKLQGCLLARTLYDENEHPIFSRTFDYDKRGNVTEETIYGRFTHDKGAIQVESSGMPTSATCDKITRRYSYSNNGFNLKTSECDPLGNYIYYNYHKGTNLLASKFTCEGKEIKKREFYSYDKNSQIETYILDDGSKEDKSNLHDVTERHITYYKRRTERPHFGEPEEISEYYFDFDKKKEVLLKKTVNSYSKNGFIAKKRVYDANEKLTSTTEYDHNKTGLLLYTKDSLGREEHFTYDKSSRLITKKGPRTDVSWHYSYDKCGRLRKETELHKDGLKLTSEYEYDLLGRKVAVIDHQGNATRYQYDALDRVTKITYPTIFDHQGHAITPTKNYTYEKLGTRVTVTDENDKQTRIDYNADGKPFAKYLPDGTTWYYRYDENGNEIREVAPNHVRTYKHYDGFNRLIASNMYTIERVPLSKKSLKYNAFHLIEETSPTNERLITRYDAAGRKRAIILTSTQENLKRETTFHYDASSRLTEERRDRVTSCYAYDDLDRIVSESIKDDQDKLHSQKIYAYDQEGNLAEVSESIMGKIATTKTSYYPHGLSKEQTNAEGHTWRYFYDYAFPNVHGQTVIKKTTVDPRGVVQVDVFDTRGSLSCSYKLDPFGNTISKQELYYDGANNLIRTHDHSIVDFKTEKLVINAFSFGPLNRIEKICEAVDTREQKTTSYHYNSFGQKEKIVHADGTTLHHTYDAKGRLQEYYANDKSLHYKYDYDASDKIRSVQNMHTGQMTKREYNEIGDIITETLESGLKLRFSYDNTGRLSQLTLPDSSQVEYRYSPVNLQSVARSGWKYEITSRDLSGHIISSTLPKNAGSITYAVDQLGRRTETSHTVFNEKATAFDAVGNLLHLKRDGVESHYTYDFLSQLMSETGHTSHAYTYDSLHNRRSLDLKPYIVNSLHSVLSDGNQSFIYDKRANRVSSDKTKYRYDANDRLVEVEVGGNRITYSYDAFNRRIQKETSVKTKKGWKSENIENYIYHLENEIGSTDRDGKLKELRILGEGLGAEIGATIATELQGKLYACLNDRRGNIVGLLDPDTAKLVESYRFDAFGNETCGKRVTSNPWRFSSKRVDPETGLVYFGRRYYDPGLGKWLTHDPLGLKAGPNLYAYVLNNPLTKFDLYGLDVEENICRALFGLSYNFMNTDMDPEVKKKLSEDKEFHQRITEAMVTCDFSAMCETWNGATPEQRASVEQSATALLLVGGSVTALKGVSNTVTRTGNGFFKSQNQLILNTKSLTENHGTTPIQTQASSKITQVDLATASKIDNVAQSNITILAHNTKVATNKTHCFIRSYIPRSPGTGFPYPLPRNANGVDVPTSMSPHTQIGVRSSSRGPMYRQTREWGENGKQIKTTDWTDHYKPWKHDNPHDHPARPNSTGGTPKEVTHNHLGYEMSKPKYLLTIKKNDYAQCRGNHLVEILQIINVKAQNITWYSSDVEITGTDAYRLGLHGWIPKRVGKTEDLISVSKRVDQFLSGVFLAMPRDLGKELQVEIATEDSEFLSRY